ncbi:MAG: hypothetical protein K0S09_3191 [Sphingobacteriaceae bacterium]|jgi:hypothetical protein|nr:hypothetical protein [Sphingobacteriaceae bacterium]
MNLKRELMETSYTPVAWEFREVIEEQIEKQAFGKIFFFCSEDGICSEEGRVRALEEIAGEGLFLVLDSHRKIRIDRIITLYGKPGAAYDEYDSYANSCMDCNGGYEKEDLDAM